MQTRMSEQKHLKRLIKCDSKWLVNVDYYAKNVEMYKDVIADDSKFTMLFNVFAETELEAKEIAIKIYESEFGLDSNVIAQQNIEDTNALSVFKCVDEETTLTF
jgi:hypothetical protein